MTLTWSEGSSPLIGYSVEYFSPDLQTGWVQAAHRVPKNILTVSTLNLYKN